jgi:hypothetical protein
VSSIRAGLPAPPPPIYPERIVWRATKDSRYAEARVRDVPHGWELRSVVGGAGRDEQLMHSCIYRQGESAELGIASQGVLQDSLRLGWMLTGA